MSNVTVTELWSGAQVSPGFPTETPGNAFLSCKLCQMLLVHDILEYNQIDVYSHFFFSQKLN